MIWPFNKRPDEAELQRLRAALSDADDAIMSWMQHAGQAESAMREMQKAMTDDGVAEIARTVTAQIADIYAAGRDTVERRDIAVHATVAEAVRKAVRGEKHWNEGRLAQDAQRAT